MPPTRTLWYRYRSAAIIFIGTLGGLLLLYQGLEMFGVKLPFDAATSALFFFLFAIILTLIRIIDRLAVDNAALLNRPQEVPVVAPDSILQMMKDAESNSRWGEIIKLGNALSEVLWYTSRKRLRIEVGHFLELAARQTGDMETLARTLIEDLGNTIMGMGDPVQGIAYITQGIKIAEDNNLHALSARGYRNLANSYSFRGDTRSAAEALAKAHQFADKLPNDKEKLEALGSISYAESKIHRENGDYPKALASLDHAIQNYTELQDAYPNTAASNKDRLVKIFREKGVLHLKMSSPDAQDQAYENFQAGLKIAQETQNHDNIVRCCSLMAQILLGKGAVPAAEGLMNIAAQSISRIDSPGVLDEYNLTNRKLLSAKQFYVQS